MAKILISGGAGFIGSHLAENLAQLENEVVILDNMDLYYDIGIKRKNIELVLKNKNCSFVEGDILDKEQLDNIVKDGIEFIFHEAAQPGVRASVDNPLKPNEVNVKGTLNILEVARKNDVKRVINASSSSVYGRVEYLPFDENHPTQPLSPYGVSKLVAEHYTRVYNELYGIPTVSLRYFTVYGPRMRPDLAIPIFTKALIKGESPTIFGNGDQTRDLTYIEDIVSANLMLLKTSGADGEILNIGGGKRVTVNQLFEYLKQLIGSDIEPIYGEEIKGDAKHTLSDVGKAEKLIGYKPTIDIETGLERFVKWYKSNLDFYPY
ncbi:MAG: SDR family oxidoreductase [Thermoplasmata archaeon]|nr:MAG: SDR family oxidoreductase [Thermoplasmata archaeon]